MKEFIIGEGDKGFTMNLPTSLKEITNDYLLGVTNQIVISEYHAIIACVYRCKLLEIINTARKKKDLATAIVPLFVKGNPGKDAQSMFDDINCGDKVIIAGTDIERGYHLVCPKNFITIDNVIRIYNSDSNFAKGVVTDLNYYYFVDFKLVPVIDIKGFYSNNTDKDFINPFIVKNTEVN